MAKVIDLFTKQPSKATVRTPAELAAYAEANEGPDFVKCKGVMVIKPETREQTDRLFEMFALAIRSSDDPQRQINTWAWLGVPRAAVDKTTAPTEDRVLINSS